MTAVELGVKTDQILTEFNSHDKRKKQQHSVLFLVLIGMATMITKAVLDIASTMTTATSHTMSSTNFNLERSVINCILSCIFQTQICIYKRNIHWKFMLAGTTYTHMYNLCWQVLHIYTCIIYAGRYYIYTQV